MFCNLEGLILLKEIAVEAWKSVLSRKKENLHSVDWLTEAIRRFSQAYLMNRGWSTVDMSVPTRVEKVTFQTKITCILVTKI